MSILAELQAEYETKTEKLAALETELVSIQEELARLREQYEISQSRKELDQLSAQLEEIKAEIAQIEYYRERALEEGNEAEVARLEALRRKREAELQAVQAEGEAEATLLTKLQEARTAPAQTFVELPLTRLKEPLEPLPTRAPEGIATVQPKAVLAEAVPEKKWPAWVPWAIALGAGMLLLVAIDKIWEG